MEKVEILKILAKAKVSPERATLYADAFVEYTAAQANVDANGAIVADPRTGSPIQNPYLVVRDKAFARLENLHKAGVRAPGLWQ